MVANLLEWNQEETRVLLQDMFEFTVHDLIGLTELNRKRLKKISRIQLLLCVNGGSENFEKTAKQVYYNGKISNNGCEAKDAVVTTPQKKIYREVTDIQRTSSLKTVCYIDKLEKSRLAFEISGRGFEPMMFIANDSLSCKKWINYIQFALQSLNVKSRLRRGGMPNIMIPSFQ